MNVLETKQKEVNPGELMSKKQVSGVVPGLIFIITGIIGAVASFLLLYERVQLWNNSDHTTACDVNPWVSCGAVMESWQAATFGFPNIFIGIIGFPILIFTGLILLLLGKQYQFLQKTRKKILWSGILFGAFFAFSFVLWLWYSAVFQIGVLCPYCMIVWAAVIPFAIYSLHYVISNDVFDIGLSTRIRTIVTSWWWVVVILIYTGIIASIIIVFPQAFLSY